MGMISKTRVKRVLLPLGLAALATLLSWTLAVFAFVNLGWMYGSAMIVIGVLAASSAGFYRYRLTKEEAEAEAIREEARVERQQLLALQKSVEDDMLGFEKQRQSFEDRLMTYHEWAEFPNVEQFAEADDQSEEVSVRDREMLERVQDTAEHIIEGFQNDRYSEEGEFKPQLLLNELVEFVESIARIYQPGAKHPLLETSVETLLKSINHITLQLLFQLEQLPLNLKDYSLSRAYDHIRKASKAYQAYRSVSPILPYVSYTWQVGRLVLGANPLIMGTWMLGSEILTRAGKKISKHYIDRYSMKLTAEAIRVVANETAQTFDKDFRYRDPEWVYGVELTELVHQFPLSRETLQVALCEIGTLPLRNSYNRIYLYRCLATGKSPNPDEFIRARTLTTEQRRQIAERLERFFRVHVHGRRKDRVEKWASAASERLSVQIQAADLATPVSPDAEASSALRSLGAFLIAVKEQEPDEIRDRLLATEVAAHTTDEARDTAIQQLQEAPPMFFDYPDLEPDGAILTLYLHDLVAFESESRPLDLQGYWAIQEVTAFYRQKWDTIDTDLIESYRKQFATELWSDSPNTPINKPLALALPRTLEADETALFIYPKVGGSSSGRKRNISRWLIGTDRRLIGVEIREDLEIDDFQRHSVFWTANRGRVALEHHKALVDDHCKIHGGVYMSGYTPENEEEGLRVSGEKLKSSQKYFAALSRWADQAAPED